MDAFLIVVLGAVAAPGFVAMGRSAYQRDRIRRSGVPRLAMITEVQTAALEGGSAMFTVKYRYVDDAGVPHEGRSPFLGYDPTLRSTGSQCEIRFDPRRPELSAWMDGR